jgi:hypothetical protein
LAELSAVWHSPAISEDKRCGQCGEAAKLFARKSGMLHIQIVQMGFKQFFLLPRLSRLIKELQQPFHFRIHAANKSGINFLASAFGIGL